MKTTYHTLILILSSTCLLLVTSCKDGANGNSDTRGFGGGPGGGTPDGVALAIDLPKENIQGTIEPMKVPNLVHVPDEVPVFLVPEGAALLSKGKKVTSSDGYPIIGSLELITDGEKDAGDGYFVELMNETQWVQIDLEDSATINALWVWHYHLQHRAYHDVIIQISDDVEFKTGVTTVFNNDYDDSSEFGKGRDRPYADSHFGLLVNGRDAKGRYVRLYSKGNTSNDMNHYTEVEVYGLRG